MRRVTVATVLSLIALVSVVHAQPSADQVLTDAGLSAGDKQNVLSGQFVDLSISGVSDRDLSFAIAYLVKTTPDDLVKQLVAGKLVTGDPQVKAVGELSAAGSLADFAQLTLTDDEARALAKAKAGEALNLSAGEIGAFTALGTGSAAAVQEQLRRMLLARYQAYRGSGLAGIARYDRGDGRTTDLAADLRRASQSTPGLQKHVPTFQKALLDYPRAALAGTQEKFLWMKSLIHDEMTYILAHALIIPDGTARVLVRRDFYVSTGYNGEQSVAFFVPVQEGTVVISKVHAFTDQVTGFGGSLKRSIGSKVMASTMQEIYEAQREKIQKRP